MGRSRACLGQLTERLWKQHALPCLLAYFFPSFPATEQDVNIATADSTQLPVTKPASLRFTSTTAALRLACDYCPVHLRNLLLHRPPLKPAREKNGMALTAQTAGLPSPAYTSPPPLSPNPGSASRTLLSKRHSIELPQLTEAEAHDLEAIIDQDEAVDGETREDLVAEPDDIDADDALLDYSAADNVDEELLHREPKDGGSDANGYSLPVASDPTDQTASVPVTTLDDESSAPLEHDREETLMVEDGDGDDVEPAYAAEEVQQVMTVSETAELVATDDVPVDDVGSGEKQEEKETVGTDSNQLEDWEEVADAEDPGSGEDLVAATVDSPVVSRRYAGPVSSSPIYVKDTVEPLAQPTPSSPSRLSPPPDTNPSTTRARTRLAAPSTTAIPSIMLVFRGDYYPIFSPYAQPSHSVEAESGVASTGIDPDQDQTPLFADADGRALFEAPINLFITELKEAFEVDGDIRLDFPELALSLRELIEPNKTVTVSQLFGYFTSVLAHSGKKVEESEPMTVVMTECHCAVSGRLQYLDYLNRLRLEGGLPSNPIVVEDEDENHRSADHVSIADDEAILNPGADDVYPIDEFDETADYDGLADDDVEYDDVAEDTYGGDMSPDELAPDENVFGLIRNYAGMEEIDDRDEAIPTLPSASLSESSFPTDGQDAYTDIEQPLSADEISGEPELQQDAYMSVTGGAGVEKRAADSLEERDEPG
ncbi:hypothetical protein BDK51DRAFT_41061 [Blyttiomyces helicus]|uniref:Uncharacterized protein n=1 Tax=Blyttiomyces helicus TaxID=388810 RepID=A0A4P9WDR1_9FUNG|nr:hypothetical protein BDK51DRAFT_41061 [Blyttiomyces helicus]|eukprot:RKO89875.1 hypothetical protein BDK51DRAFT_41061 [Blyttiomyces helicus]